MHRIRPLGEGVSRALSGPAQIGSPLHRFLALPVVLFAILTSALGCGAEHPDSFISGVRFDTVVVVGRADEQRPLLLYGSPVPQLVNDSTVVYSDPDNPGRMVVVNLFSGDGWEVVSSVGALGPGEFGGAQPIVSSSRGVIHTVTPEHAVYNAWTMEGELISNVRYSSNLFANSSNRWIAVMGPRVVISYAERFGEELVRLVRRGIRIYDPDLGLIAEVTDGIPDYRVRVVPGERNTVRYESIDQVPLVVRARGETIVWGLARQTGLTVLNADGSIRTSGELEAPMETMFVDNDERIWVVTNRRGADGLATIVLDRDLRVLFRAGTRWAVDASGDYVLAFMGDDQLSGGRAMTLLRMEQVR